MPVAASWRARLVAAAEWLAVAQDANEDGGVSGRFSLRTGWSSSYPETTGYIIPTFLALGEELNPEFVTRAHRCAEFLLDLQLAEGGFPGGEVDENRTRPSVFNTAQIVNGLLAWHIYSKDQRAADAVVRAADWLVKQQDADGAWRKHVHKHVTTYTTHASCWLAEAARHFGVDRWADSAERHLNWALTHTDSGTGWIDGAGFSDVDHARRTAVTHTVAYTIWGILHSSLLLDRKDATQVARRAANGVMGLLESSGWLPGEIDHRWRGARSDYACLTGNAQMALIWFRLAALDGRSDFENAGLKALRLVKAAQPMTVTEPGIHGGIPGSEPIWGAYNYMALPNWAAKFYIDALLAERRCTIERVATTDRMADRV